MKQRETAYRMRIADRPAARGTQYDADTIDRLANAAVAAATAPATYPPSPSPASSATAVVSAASSAPTTATTAATAGPQMSGRIACLCTPSLYAALVSRTRDRCSDATSPLTAPVVLLEYDRRFAVYAGYVFYDYRRAHDVPAALAAAFDVLLLDPPFLSAECLQQVAETARYLARPTARIVLCTGATMEAETARLALGLRRCRVCPQHRGRRLANGFACYSNFDSVWLDAP